eukprot:Selendium_serpulae@DN9143_c0_g1_i1.p2
MGVAPGDRSREARLPAGVGSARSVKVPVSRRSGGREEIEELIKRVTDNRDSDALMRGLGEDDAATDRDPREASCSFPRQCAPDASALNEMRPSTEREPAAVRGGPRRAASR